MKSGLTHEQVQRILNIIDEAEHIEELDLVCGDFRLHISKSSSGARLDARTDNPRPPSLPVRVPPKDGAATSAPIPATPTVPNNAVPAGMVGIRAPMLGTFYRSPAPGEKPFVEVGQKVRADDTVCLIEVMKLFNSIRAEVDGTIEEIRAQNSEMVEYDQVLFVIRQAKD